MAVALPQPAAASQPASNKAAAKTRERSGTKLTLSNPKEGCHRVVTVLVQYSLRTLYFGMLNGPAHGLSPDGREYTLVYLLSTKLVYDAP